MNSDRWVEKKLFVSFSKAVGILNTVSYGEPD